MAVQSNYARCEEARRNLDDLHAQQDAQQNEIWRLEEQIRVREGEISEAENTLSSIAEAGDIVSEGVAGVVVNLAEGDRRGAAADAAETAIRLANEVSRQRQELANLRRQLDDETWQLKVARDKLALIERDIDQAMDFLDANDCR